MTWSYGTDLSSYSKNGTTENVYYYIKNLKGDVTMIVNASLSVVARYSYDPWGKCTITNVTGTLGDINPLRYRGYYYDTESGFYYLESRYYDPEVCRFIGIDDISTVTNATTLTDKNLYAYCDNNPVNRIDDQGDFWEELKAVGKAFVKAGIVVGAIASTVFTIAGAAAFTIGTGGAGGAVAIPAAIAVSQVMIATAVATVAVGSVAVAAGNAGSNISKKSGKNKSTGKNTQNNNNAGRSKNISKDCHIDYEYNGNGTGNVHYHNSSGKYRIWELSKKRRKIF